MELHVPMIMIVDTLVPALQDLRVIGVTSPVMVCHNSNLFLYSITNVLPCILKINLIILY